MSDNGLLRHLAVFLYIKSQFKNSCVYNYTQQSLSDKTGLSRSAIRKYAKFFLDNGWCRIDTENLIFNKLKSFDTNKKKIIIEIKTADIKSIILEFHLQLLKHKQAQFDKMRSLRADYVSPSNTKAHKLAKETVKRLGYNVDKLPLEGSKLQISIKKLSVWLNCSAGKVSGILKSLQKRRLITIERVKHIVGYSGSFEGAKALLNMNKNSYYLKGFVIQVSCNYYNF